MQANQDTVPAATPTQHQTLDQIFDKTEPPLDDDQKRVVRGIIQSVESGEPIVVVVTGYAGTGKSVILATVAEYLTQPPIYAPSSCPKHDEGTKGECTCPGEWVVAAPTHKAAGVLIKKGIAGVSTLHSILTTPKTEDCSLEEANIIFQKVRSGEKLTKREESVVKPVFKPKDGSKTLAGIIVDESSMVTHDLNEMILQRNVPVVFFGDAGQLPPVDQFRPDFSVLDKPDFTLEKVYRNDGNILALSMHLREGGRATSFSKRTQKDDLVVTTRHSDAKAFDPDVVLAWKNTTVFHWNQRIRAKRGYDGPIPQPGETIVFEKGIRGADIHKSDTATITYAVRSGDNSVMASFVSDVNGKSYDADLDLNFFLVPKPEAEMPEIVTCNYNKYQAFLQVATKARFLLGLTEVVPITKPELDMLRFGKSDDNEDKTQWADWKYQAVRMINARQRELSEKLKPPVGAADDDKAHARFIGMVRSCRVMRLYVATLAANMETTGRHTVGGKIESTLENETFLVANPYGAIPARFAYAMTVHKSQGSEFEKVLFVQDMPQTNPQFRKLAYTAATRAKSELMLYIA